VLSSLPGELAPKLAIAATAELRGSRDDAMRYYDAVWRTDRSYLSAAFGLSRQRERAGDRVNAIAALDQIPSASSHFTAAGATAIEVLLEGRTSEHLDEQTLLDADKRAGALNLESTSKRATIRLRVLDAALDWLRHGNKTKTPRILGADFDERGIRTGMERCYRELAHETDEMWARIALVERANAIRPRTRV
jgi:serine/threonine-protein kinase PknG